MQVKRDRLYCPIFRKHCTLEITIYSDQVPGQASESACVTRKCLNATNCDECEACQIINR